MKINVNMAKLIHSTFSIKAGITIILCKSVTKGLNKVFTNANGAFKINEKIVGFKFNGFIRLPAFSLIAKLWLK